MTGDAVRKAKSRMKTRLRLESGSLFDEIVRDAGVVLDQFGSSLRSNGVIILAPAAFPMQALRERIR
jgi:hypothetical protein